MVTSATDMEKQYTTNLHWKPLEMLPLHITKLTIRSCTLYHRLQQLDVPFKNITMDSKHTYLASVFISTWLHHC